VQPLRPVVGTPAWEAWLRTQGPENLLTELAEVTDHPVDKWRDAVAAPAWQQQNIVAAWSYAKFTRSPDVLGQALKVLEVLGSVGAAVAGVASGYTGAVALGGALRAIFGGHG
jgi:hypothetical protein